MEKQLKKLNELIAESIDLHHASSVLSWDMQTYMPPGGNQDRGNQIATLDGIAHARFTSPEVGQLLDDLKPWAESLDPDSDEARLIRVIRRNYDKRTRVPTSFVAEFARVTSMAHEAWVRARATGDFAVFQPHLEKIVEMQRHYATLFSPYDHIYDPLLDEYEPGMKTAEVQSIFNAIRGEQVALIQAISERPQVDDSFLHLAYPEQAQWDFGVEVITRFGYDWSRGRQDRTAHPFTTSFGHGDVRITTRFDPNYAASALFSTMHESGHALYDQGVIPAYNRTMLYGASSMAIHESQSRMWENLVGRSLPFWSHFYPRFQEVFPSQLGGVDLATFYRGVNKVEPSYIRTEADEATYNLHIMLRLELEIALMEGKLEVRDLPEQWNEKMKEYLGLVPPNQSLGVLQDVHWSYGYFGYFPTYALGNLISVQLWEKIQQDIPDLENQIARGEFAALLEWLRSHIHCYGAKYEPQELVRMATGAKIDPQPYLRYLKTKYSEIYGL